MNNRLIALLSLALLVALCSAPASRADSLDVTLTEADQTVIQGTTVVEFDASILNPSTTDTIYLNSDTSTTNSLFVSVDDSPFFANAPIFLDPGQSTSTFALFDIDLPADITDGIYSGVFSILGGPDGGTNTDFGDLADVDFSVDVTSPVATPEPNTLLLMGTGLLGLIFLRKRLNFSA